jgi:fructose-1,6-bisphosphatase I
VDQCTSVYCALTICVLNVTHIQLVITFMKGVHRFTLDDSIGEFVYMGPVNFPSKPKMIYSINEGNYQVPQVTLIDCPSCQFIIIPCVHLYCTQLWDEKIQMAVEKFKNPTEPGAKPYSARYVGSMVSDVHRTILYGGIFMYPADKKSSKGKLRLLYEGLPMASIIEQAGGVASTGFFQGKVSLPNSTSTFVSNRG